MTIGSLFSGIGGIDLGFERAGFAPVWQVEINPFRRDVLAKHWPNVRRHDDVRTFCRTAKEMIACRCCDDLWCELCKRHFFECDCIGLSQFGDEWQIPDIIAGGFPCQDVSNAGKQEGIDGKRSGLWSEFARIIGLLRPRYVVVENVGALTVRGLQRILGDFAQRGYDAEWANLSAASFGAVFRRARLFIVAYAAGDGLEGRITTTQELQKSVPALDHPGNWPAVSEPFGCRNINGIPFGMERLEGLGDSVVPQVAEWIARRILTVFPVV